MKRLIVNQKSLLFISSFVLTLFVLVGCGEMEEENNQPEIGAIPDQTLDVGQEAELTVRITDTNKNVITYEITSNNTDVATVSIQGRQSVSSSETGSWIRLTLIITAVDAGETTITVSAKDNSLQENAEATPVVFKVTVNKPSEKLCKVGDLLMPGDSCIDPGTNEWFEVLDDGRAKYAFSTVGTGINLRVNINGKFHDFAAERIEGNTWEIKRVTPE